MTETKDMLTRLEDAIIQTLKQILPQEINRIETFNEEAEEYDFPQGDGAAVFVLYAGSSYGPNDDDTSSAYAPRRTLRWQIFVLVRSLNSKNNGAIGANHAIEAVRLALQGQSILGATPFLIQSDKLDARIDNGWRYVLEFTHHIPAISEIRFDPAAAPAFE